MFGVSVVSTLNVCFYIESGFTNTNTNTHTPNASLQYPFQYTRINFYKYISISDSLEHIRFSGSQNTNGVNSLNLIMGCHSSANTTLFNGLNISIFQKVGKKSAHYTISVCLVWFFVPIKEDSVTNALVICR